MKNLIELIETRLREDIRSGRLRPGDALPTRRALAEQCGTTVDTIAVVLHHLEIEGLLVRGKGRTMRVNPSRERITANDERFADVMIARGHDVKVEHLATPKVIEASPEIARAFHRPPGFQIVERRRREIVDGMVYRYSRKMYLAELVPEDVLEAMQKDHTYNVRQVVEKQRPLSRIEERIIARAIVEKEEAAILNVARGTPVLEQTRINYDQDRQVVWISIVVFNAAYFVKQYDYQPGDEPKSTDFLGIENKE